MTGYGRAESQIGNRTFVFEIRSLNSKTIDMSVRLAPELRAHELALRGLITKRVERGKIDASLLIEERVAVSGERGTGINWEAAKAYAAQYEAQFGAPVPPEVMAAILRMPAVSKVADEPVELPEEEWTAVEQLVVRGLEAFDAFRRQEGAALQTMFTEKLDGIEALLAQVEPFEKGRVAKIRERLEASLAQLSAETQAQIDRNRLEQEMIYYLEKLDITEEKVRLTNHIRYFREVMAEQTEVSGVGKKLGFVAQEMGREINTLGSKSNQSEMQVIVVKMKDLLEQIKEQVLNVL